MKLYPLIIQALLCRHEWKPTKFQALVPGTTVRCTKCGKQEHRA